MLVDDIFRRGEGRASLQEVGFQPRLVPDSEIGLDLPPQTDRLRLKRRALGCPLPAAEQGFVRDADGPIRADKQSCFRHLVHEFGRGAGGNEGSAIGRVDGQAPVLVDIRHEHAEQRIESGLPRRGNGREHGLGMGGNGALESADPLIGLVGQSVALARGEELRQRHLEQGQRIGTAHFRADHFGERDAVALLEDQSGRARRPLHHVGNLAGPRRRQVEQGAPLSQFDEIGVALKIFVAIAAERDDDPRRLIRHQGARELGELAPLGAVEQDFQLIEDEQDLADRHPAAAELLMLRACGALESPFDRLRGGLRRLPR